MSIRIMSDVWQVDLPASQKIVLLALADSANDEGHCWPGMASLARKCSKSERTVQAMLNELEQAGHITRRQAPGHGCNYYVHPRKTCTPAKPAPPQICAEPPQNSHPTPAKSAPKPSLKHKKRNMANQPEGVSDQTWTDFKALRERKKAPLTTTAMNMILKEVALSGWTVEQALGECVLRGWQAFKAAWVEKIEKPAPAGYDPFMAKYARYSGK